LYLLLSCVPSWAQSARSFWSQRPSSWRWRKTPALKKLPTALPVQTAAAAATQAVRTTQRLWSWTACPATSAHPAAPRLPLPLPRSWAARPALWKRRRLSSVRAIPSTASLLMITRASRPVQPLLHCTAAPRPAPLPALVWATAPRCVSSMLSTLWTVLPRWTRTSAPAAVPAQTSAPSRSS